MRAAALEAWEASSPGDPRLAERLRQFTSDRNRQIREDAIKKLATLHSESDLALLRKLSEDPDPSVAEFAKEGIEEIEAFVKR